MAPKRIRVTVTQDDIDRGEAHNSSSCPIALALARKTGGECGVGKYSAIVEGIRYGLSRAAENFVRDFDDYRPVEPATFVLSRP